MRVTYHHRLLCCLHPYYIYKNATESSPCTSRFSDSILYLSTGVAFAEVCGRRLRGFALGFLEGVASGGVSSAACFAGADDAVVEEDAELFSDLLLLGAVSLSLIFKAGCAINDTVQRK